VGRGASLAAAVTRPAPAVCRTGATRTKAARCDRPPSPPRRVCARRTALCRECGATGKRTRAGPASGRVVRPLQSPQL